MSLFTFVPSPYYNKPQGVVNDGHGNVVDIGALLAANNNVITVDDTITPWLVPILKSYPGLVLSNITPVAPVTADVIGPIISHLSSASPGSVPVLGNDGIYAPGSVVGGTGVSGISQRGAWQANGVQYYINDMVEYGGTQWLNQIKHISGATFDGPVHWQELGSFRGTWQANTLYEPTDTLLYNGSLYQVNTAFTSGGTFDATNLTQLTQSPNLALQKSSNLSDVANTASARTNLGLGSAATQNTTAFDAAGAASSAAGAAQSASLQKSSNLSDLNNSSTARTNLGLGSAATQSSSVFAGVSGNTSDDIFSIGAGTGVKLPFGLVHAAVHGVKGDGSLTDAGLIRAAIASGDDLFFPGPLPGHDYVIPDGSLPITTPGQFIFSPSGRWRVTGRPFPLFDVRTGADGVRIVLDHPIYDQSVAPSWVRIDDLGGHAFRGERNNSCVNAIYSCAEFGEFTINHAEGFYVVVFLTSWNLGINNWDPGTVLRHNNKVLIKRFENSFVGLAWTGQRGMRFDVSGSYQAQGALGQKDYNPPHAIYCTTDVTSVDCGGDGYCYDSTGSGHSFDVVTTGTPTGGTLAITVQLNDGSAAQTANIPLPATAAQVAPLISALPNVGANMVSVYDLPDPLNTTGTGWRLTFDHSLGSLVYATGVSVNNAAVQPSPPAVIYAVSELQPWNSGAPWRAKTLSGGTFGRLESNNTPGSLEIVTSSSGITIATVRSVGAVPASGGACTIDSTTSNVVVESYEENLAGDGRILNLLGTDNEIRHARMTANSSVRYTTDPYAVIRGTRNKLHAERLVNFGAGGRFGIQQWSGDSCVIEVERMGGLLEQGVALLSGVTNTIVEVDSRKITGWSPAALNPVQPWVDSSGQISNRFNRYDVRRRNIGIWLPQEQGWPPIAQAPNANRAYFLRCYLDQWMLVKNLFVFFTGTLTGSEKYDWGIYDQTGAALWRLGQTTVGAGTGSRGASVPSASQYYPGASISYFGFVMDTAIAMYMANFAAGSNMTYQLSSVLPYPEHFALDGQTTGLPASMTSASTGAGAVPILGVRST